MDYSRKLGSIALAVLAVGSLKLTWNLPINPNINLLLPTITFLLLSYGSAYVLDPKFEKNWFSSPGKREIGLTILFLLISGVVFYLLHRFFPSQMGVNIGNIVCVGGAIGEGGRIAFHIFGQSLILMILLHVFDKSMVGHAIAFLISGALGFIYYPYTSYMFLGFLLYLRGVSLFLYNKTGNFWMGALVQMILFLTVYFAGVSSLL